MRQRAGMVEHLAKVAQVNPSTACRALLEMPAVLLDSTLYDGRYLNAAIRMVGEISVYHWGKRSALAAGLADHGDGQHFGVWIKRSFTRCVSR
jgi:hypothetical protein